MRRAGDGTVASHTVPNRGDVLDDGGGGPPSSQTSGKVSTTSGPTAAARHGLSNWAPRVAAAGAIWG